MPTRPQHTIYKALYVHSCVSEICESKTNTEIITQNACLTRPSTLRVTALQPQQNCQPPAHLAGTKVSTAVDSTGEVPTLYGKLLNS
eukprot:scaffold207_cov409-Prasinococcus_capsulatus_cf.AAC.68